MQVGIGYDVHAFAEGEDLILGGVEIDYCKGLVGHSDADVVLHALMDALLGAMGAGDIGRLFPDNDPAYEGVSSLILLKEVKLLMIDRGFLINNLDLVIIAQRPKLANQIRLMEEKIVEVLEIDISKINIKATTTERLGFVGREEGIAVEAIASLKKE